MKLKGLTALAVLALAAIAALVAFPADSASAQAPAPMLFKGTVAVSGQPAPDGYDIFARVTARDGTLYQSESVKTQGGLYSFLVVAPPPPQRFGATSPYHGQTITFYLNGEQAMETHTYVASGLPDLSIAKNLSFAALPTPTPTITPIPPTATPVPPGPTSTPIPTVADRMQFSTGLIVALTGVIPEGAVLTARVGDAYTSAPADTIAPDGKYYGLIVDPVDVGLIGEDIKFFLNGIESRTTRKFESGATVSSFDLLFELPEVPTPTPEPTAVPPTATPMPAPTATPLPTPMPEPTPVPATPMPATPPTPVPAPPTPVPPTPAPTPEPPTATPEPTPEPEATATSTPLAAPPAPPPPPEPTGGCGAVESGSLPFGTAAANLALLLAPLGLIGVRKLTIRHRRRR